MAHKITLTFTIEDDLSQAQIDETEAALTAQIEDFSFHSDSFEVEKIETTRQEATDTIELLVRLLGNGFHPDNYIADYVDGKDEPFFLPQECEFMQVALDRALKVLGDDVYKIAEQFMSKKDAQ